MTHGLSGETEKAGGGVTARQTAEKWYAENQEGTIRPQDIKYILFDWQNERVEFVHLLLTLEWSAETIDGAKMCPYCGLEKADGHVVGCKIAKAIA